MSEPSPVGPLARVAQAIENGEVEVVHSPRLKNKASEVRPFRVPISL